MKSVHIQAEVRVDQLLKIFKTEEDNFYICYIVAMMLKDQIEKVPGFHEHRKEHYGDDHALHYSFLLVKRAAGPFCQTVVQYFNQHIEKHFPNSHVYPSAFMIHTLALYKPIESDVRLGFIQWNRITRIKMMERILNDDPEAVISMHFQIDE